MSTELDQDRRDALLERVERRGRQLRRRRHLARLAVVATTLVVIAGATTAAVLTRGGNPIARMHTVAPASSSSAATAGTTSVTPSWLPPGTYRVNTQLPCGIPSGIPLPSTTVPGVTQTTYPGQTPPTTTGTSTPPCSTQIAQYQLPGEANANTFPGGNPGNAPQSLQAIESGLYHPADFLEVSFTPGLTSMPPGLGDPRYFVTQQVTIGGFAAQLSYASNGYGPVRIDWLDPQGYHNVTCVRGRTASGTAGLSNADLIRVADSLYT
ncbi:MAG: hypothetical protein J2P57_24310 [Acidimicrobiaceae bacterium]|nr:hypothetical protein [Acidimicrobiaceae bacterium]